MLPAHHRPDQRKAEQFTLETTLQGALVAVEYQHNPQGIGNRLSALDQGRHDPTLPVILRLSELQQGKVEIGAERVQALCDVRRHEHLAKAAVSARL